MEMQKLTAELQSRCHEGDSKVPVRIKILDTFYKIKAIKKTFSNEKEYYVIEAD